MSLLSPNPVFASIKMYAYGAIVTIGLAFSIYVVIHERHVGEQKILARDQKIDAQRKDIATAAALHTKDVEANAQLQSDLIGLKYAQALAASVVSPPHVLCYRAAPSTTGSQVPRAADSQPRADGQADSSSEDPVDIGPPLDTIGKDADAQITALQEQVNVLLDAMNGKTK